MIYVALHKIAGYTSPRGRLEGRSHPPLYSSILLKGAASPAAPFFCLVVVSVDVGCLGEKSFEPMLNLLVGRASGSWQEFLIEYAPNEVS